MTGSRVARLILALTALLGLAAPDAAVGYSCFRSTTWPPPNIQLPLQQPGAVLFWKDSDPSSGANNTLVVGLGEHVQSGDCFQPIACPFAIAVGPDSALVFTGLDNLGQGNRVSPWGAVNVPLGSTVINVAGAQGRSEDWDEASSVAVVDPASLHVVFSGNGDNYNFSGSDLTGSSFAGLVRAAVPEPAQLRLRHARR